MEMTLLEAVDDGRVCGWCGDDIRINVPEQEQDLCNFWEGDSATPGERGLCEPCTIAGNDKDNSQG